MDTTLFKEIQDQTQFCMLRNDHQQLDKIFFAKCVKKHFGASTTENLGSIGQASSVPNSGAEKDVGGLDKTQFLEALQEAGCFVDNEAIDEVLTEFDTDCNGSIGLEEFKCAVRRSPKHKMISSHSELKGFHQQYALY